MTVTDMGRHESEWTRDELAFLDSNLHLSLDALCSALDKDAVAVSRAKARLESPQLDDPWAVEDDEFVLRTPNLTAKQVARLLGRSYASVTNRRKVLAEVKGVKFGEHGSNKSPYHVGARQLIAKTCTQCGKLVSSEWFKFSPAQNRKGGWSPACKKCQSASSMRQGPSRYHGSDRYREKTKLSRKRLQDMTVPLATRGKQPWLDSDHTILRDPDLTLLEKALKLKRSYNAVSIICSSNGYKSHVGLGEATDLWRIFNPNEMAA